MFIRKLLLLTVAQWLFFQALYCQKLFRVQIQLPDVDYKKIGVFYNNGKQQKKIFADNQDGKLVISDTLFFRYAAVYFTYPASTGKNLFHIQSFWVDSTPADIHFLNDTSSMENPLQTYKLTNAYDMREMGGAQFEKFIAKERDDFDDLINKYTISHIYAVDSLRNLLSGKAHALFLKKLQYVKQNPASYYSLWLFGHEIINYTRYSADSFLLIYNTIFPDSLKHTAEGRYYGQLLSSRVAVKKGRELLPFSAKEIGGKWVNLESYRGKKMILLDFWASWCEPCIKQIPDIETIAHKYAGDKLEIISVSLDRTPEAFINGVKQYKPVGLQVLDTQGIASNYGVLTIPRMLLLNKEGMVIYDSDIDDKEADHKHLRALDMILSNNLKPNEAEEKKSR